VSRAVAKSDYTQKDLLVRADKSATRVKYLAIYNDFISNGYSHAELASKHKTSVATVGRAIKWAVLSREGEDDEQIIKRAMEDRVMKRLQSLNETMQKARMGLDIPRILHSLNRIINDLAGESKPARALDTLSELKEYIQGENGTVENELAVSAEIRKTLEMLAKVQKVVRPEGAGQGQVTLNFNMPSGLNRGKGVGSLKDVESPEVVSEQSA